MNRFRIENTASGSGFTERIFMNLREGRKINTHVNVKRELKVCPE
jgi:predicted Zn-dependent peptidase